MIYENIKFADYLALPGLNASTLKPYSISAKFGEYKRAKEFNQSEAMNLGSLVHAYILEGQKKAIELLKEDYIIEGFPVNPSTGKPYGEGTQKYTDWAATLPAHKSILKPDKVEEAIEIYKAVAEHEPSAAILKECTKRETAITWTCSHTGEKMKALVDFFGKKTAGDLKTYGREEMHLNGLQSEMYKRQYHLQFAFYMDGLQANGFNIEAFYVIFAQSIAPYDVGCFAVNYTAIEQGRTDYIQAVANYHKAQNAAKANKPIVGLFPYLSDINIPYFAISGDF